MRRLTSIAVTALALAGWLAGGIGAASAQYYPPQPPAPGYQSYPPSQPYGPQTYSSAPLPPASVTSSGSPYDTGYTRQPGQYPQSYPPPYPANGAGPPQPLSAEGGRPGLAPPADVTGSIPAPNGQESGPPSDPAVVAALPPEDQPDQGPPTPLPPQFQRQLVNYPTTEPAGTIIVDTPHTYLYLIMGHGKALRYGIGVGREGFTWSGTERISRMKEWPDWYPPKEMIERQPYLPRFMAGGESNPLGARALYLGNTLYRIHGTNQPSSIGKFVSSGCIHLTNADIEDLYDRVQVGTRVVVLPGTLPPNAMSESEAPSDYYAQTPASQQAAASSQAPVNR
ncbi:MAG: L,D-transpeptidase family protein [Xanthobacteraceae bacterium]